MDKIELAKSIATVMHEGSVDRGGRPYIGHPAAVAAMVASEDEKIVAWLHDVLEDTPFPAEAIKLLFGSKIAAAMDAVTHRKYESYEDYIRRLSENEIARHVKIADLTHNSDLSRIKNPGADDLARVGRYRQYLDFLRSFE